MRLSELLKSAGVEARRQLGDVEVTDITADSRRCRTGSCFVAVRGAADDGHKFIPSALAAGASAIVCEDDSAVPQGTACAVVENSRLAIARLTQAIFGWPARKLACVGVTGTNGKSTTTCLIRDILEEQNCQPALLGTITYETGAKVIEANQTTPDPESLARMTAEMVAAGRTHLIMETSSHALHQDRVAGLEFRVGVFTNLTGDHLDYHKTMDQYRAAKRRLFEQLPAGGFAVINQDDPSGAAPDLAGSTKAEVILYGLSPSADLRGRIERIDAAGTLFEMSYAGKSARVQTPLIGRHNVYNCLAAAGACLGLGVSLDAIARTLSHVHNVPGRLERVQAGAAPFEVFVDYAHTDDALVNVLSALRPVTKKSLVLVFGCGGDRDRTKRPRMAKVAQELADRILVTSDNPRSEHPQAILDEIKAGFTSEGLGKVQFEVDRRKAIAAAIGGAGAGDIVLIAGKGHEKYQIVGKVKHDFDDVKVASEMIAARGGNA